jgi:predicted N-acetyltransferase YhbS
MIKFYSMSEIYLSNLEKKPELYKDTIQLIEKSFNYSKDQSFEIDFAPLMHKENHKNCHILIKNEKVIGHIGTRRVNFGNKNSTFPLIMMGGICISEEERGKGHFKSFFEQVYNLYKDKSGLFALWSDKEDFYSKLGFYQAGGQIVVQSSVKPTGATEGPYKFSELGIEDISLMMMIYEDFASDKWTIQRDMSDWEILRNIESCQIHFIPSRLEPHGYIISNKGQDLNDVSHEIVFYEGLYDQYKNHLSTTQAWVPEGLTEGPPSLYTAFFKIGDPQKFGQMIYSLTGNQIAISSIDQKEVVFGFDGENYEASHEEFLRYIFGPGPLEEFESVVRPLVISGLDSI